MLFSSYSFLLIALPLLIIVYYILPQRFRNICLLFASLGFYAWSGAKYLLIMFASILVNYLFAILISECKKPAFRTLAMTAGVVADLLILGYFKYYMFLVENINSIFDAGIGVRNIVLPIGISFYTFQGMSYIIDVKRGTTGVQKNILKLALYISLFPQLIAGPIVRYTAIRDEIDSRSVDAASMENGIFRFVIGLSKKVLIANTIGEYAAACFSAGEARLSIVTAWLGAIAFTLQIYYDFSGYSDMAIGIGRIFGFHFPENFNYPYISSSITEFWRRWHMTLSSWFRDYVYIPLGGNRKGLARQIVNILIVWMLTGFWHGASYNFILWGLYYGILLMIEKIVSTKFDVRLPGWIKHVVTLVLIVIGWVIFQADDLSHAAYYLRAMFDVHTNRRLFLIQFRRFIDEQGVVLFSAILGSTPLVSSVAKKVMSKMRGGVAVAVKTGVFLALLFLCVMRIVVSSYNPFIYFRF